MEDTCHTSAFVRDMKTLETLMVSTALEKSNEGRTSILVGEDTDLTSINYCTCELRDVYVDSRKGNRNHNVLSGQILDALGELKQHIMLFIHAIL